MQRGQARCGGRCQARLGATGRSVDRGAFATESGAVDDPLRLGGKALLTLAESRKAQLAAQEADLARLRAVYQLKKDQVALLKVRAGLDGVLQRLGELSQLQEGQQIAAGANLARVANPKRLKAEIKMPGDPSQGHRAEPERGHRHAQRHYRRGTSSVSTPPPRVAPSRSMWHWMDPCPKARDRDLTVDGTIQLEKLEDVVYVDRPVHGEPESTVSLFKIVEAGKAAVRVPVKLGRSSVSYHRGNRSKAAAGEQIILSDMSQWDGQERVRLN